MEASCTLRKGGVSPIIATIIKNKNRACAQRLQSKNLGLAARLLAPRSNLPRDRRGGEKSASSLRRAYAEKLLLETIFKISKQQKKQKGRQRRSTHSRLDSDFAWNDWLVPTMHHTKQPKAACHRSTFVAELRAAEVCVGARERRDQHHESARRQNRQMKNMTIHRVGIIPYHIICTYNRNHRYSGPVPQQPAGAPRYDILNDKRTNLIIISYTHNRNHRCGGPVPQQPTGAPRYDTLDDKRTNLIKKLATPPYVASRLRSPPLLSVTKEPTPFAQRDPKTSIHPFALNLMASEVGRYSISLHGSLRA